MIRKIQNTSHAIDLSTLLLNPEKILDATAPLSRQFTIAIVAIKFQLALLLFIFEAVISICLRNIMEYVKSFNIVNGEKFW